MFCKKCGSDIKEGVSFCPKCGEKFAKPLQESTPQRDTMSFSTPPYVGGQEKASNGMDEQKKKLFIGIAAVILAVVLIVVLVGAFKGNKKSYSLTGTWNSEEAVNLENTLREYMINQMGLSDWVADAVMELTGFAYIGDLTLTFSESGSLWLGGQDVGVSIGSLTYEKISDNAMMLKFSIDVPIVGEVSASYKAAYKLNKDSLSLDLFGAVVNFKRKE